jgi:GH35 family endo-1,4-beta-xylanase
MNNPIAFADNEIKKNRIADVQLEILKPDGSPLAGREVEIAQTSHKFLFGIGGFDIMHAVDGPADDVKEMIDLRVEKLTALFNYVTLPFYWGRFEPQRGKPMTDLLRRTAQWCVDHHLLVKGHPLCWHTVTADWLLPLSNAEILEAQIGRIRREVSGFRGLIDSWDVLNEAVIMPIFDKYDNGITRICKEMGRIETIRTMFDTARETNPTATLLLNDFDVSPAYDILVEGCLEAGIKIDVIGIQSHMHQGYWGVEKTLQVLEQFSRFKLPIHFTETTLVSGNLMPPEIVDLNDYQVTDWPTTPAGEERQAREVLQHYKTLLAHPLVEGITWWDFADGSWLNAPSGLIHKDATSKPAYEELLKLVKDEWWLKPTRFTTDEQGKIRFSGFLGGYEVRFDGKSHPIQLNAAGAGRINIQI